MNKIIVSRRAVLALGLVSLVGACSQYLPEGKTGPQEITRDLVMAKINAVRAANGRKPLAYNDQLELAARAQADLMAATGEFSHTVGGALRQRVTAVGYQGAVGENLAEGQNTLEGAIAGWLASARHRSTLLSPKFTEFGLAAAKGEGRHDIYWAMIFGGDFAAWLS
ncbi:hypothetical protein MNBD_ALPHA12-2098 [hydrothermal vent metagenome]|uniref:SCP domain-containing protein n=1 Tax=hydrothermal vent metagenome TaxID=652676 RepID=A0A3B0TYJ0_9ZZZZ